MKTLPIPAYLQKLFDKYKYVLLVCLVGIILLLWPQGEPTAELPRTEGEGSPDQVALLEEKIRLILEDMDGVGKVRVLLTVETGAETQYAYDRTDSENRTETGGSASRQTQLVTVTENGGQAPVPIRTWAPQYRGAVVVCEGGGSAAVRLAVTQVIQSLTGISTDRIVISKMKQ